MGDPFDQRQLYDKYWDFFSGQNCRTVCDADDRNLEPLSDFAEEVPRIILDAFGEDALWGDVEDDPERYQELGILVRSLDRVRAEFSKGPESARLFRWTYPAFARKRRDSVRCLRRVAGQMDESKFNCNVATVAGSSIGILGGGLMIAGAVSSVLTAGLAAPIALGGTMALFGTGSNLVTSVKGTVDLNRNIERAKEIINEDKRHFTPFSDWLDNSREIKDAISSVMDITLMKRMVNDIATLFKQTCSFKKKICDFTDRIHFFVRIYVRLNEYAASNIYLLVESLILLVGFLFSLACLKIRNELLYTTGVTALKLGLFSAIMLNVGVDAFTAALSSLKIQGALVPKFLLPASARNSPGFLSRVAAAKQMLVSGLSGQASVVRDVALNFSSGRIDLSGSAVASGLSAARNAVVSGLSGQASLAGGVVSGLTRRASAARDLVATRLFGRAATKGVSVSVGRVAARTTFLALGVGLDVATVVLACIDLKKGSVSEMAVQVRDAADKLEDELWSLQKIFDELMPRETWVKGANEHGLDDDASFHSLALFK